MFPPTWSSPPWTNIEVKTVSIGGGAPARAVSIRGGQMSPNRHGISPNSTTNCS